MLVIILKAVLLFLILLCGLSIVLGLIRHDYFFMIIAILFALAVWILKLQINKSQNDPFA